MPQIAVFHGCSAQRRSPLPSFVRHAEAYGEEHLAVKVLAIAYVIEGVVHDAREGARFADGAGVHYHAQVLVGA